MNFVNLKNCMDNLVNISKTPGVDCIVYKEHKPIFRYYTGMSDIENKIPMNGKELYYIFSMTKMLTVTCALQLFEKDKFRMEDPLSKYLPEFADMKITHSNLDNEDSLKVSTGLSVGKHADNNSHGFAKNHITIKNLFTMTAGFDYNVNAPYFKKAITEGETNTLDLVKKLSDAVLWFEPGTRFKYSLCHDVLGGLIEVWSGMKFGDYMKKNVLEPLEMNNTFFGDPKDEDTLSKMAALYTFEYEDTVPSYDKDGAILPARTLLDNYFNLTNEYESGGAGLISSAEDYAIFLDALANGGIGANGNRILKSDTVELMKTNQLTGEALEDFYKLRNGYGYGLGVRTHIDSNLSGSYSPLGEFGWDGAAGAFSLVDTTNKLSLTYFQHARGWEVKMQDEIRNALYKDLQ